ncbi:hypothetical protein [Dyadobacter sediminis]|uniref:Uncharacterized protein n=1 Tax=Dyadobacter sediminis TaxID=1493691 RepID=A0A5R9KBJ0_9BACT|nr:hypothetical protein [Dyadobacter sediminis]TLU92099.1 hypothetical protein FEM55_15225 [Dyadobacter sediminis]GGB97449.1 hypothetical protein GCM10011325_25970 [Dyadobacter sediminis]
MKKLFTLVLITLLGCKEEFTPAPVFSFADLVIRSIKIEGVSQENIVLKNDRIMITLPADYPSGSNLRVSIEPKGDFRLISDLSKGIAFEGQDVYISFASSTHDPVHFPVYVKPAAPWKVKSEGVSEVFISRYTELALTMQNFGTARSYPENQHVSVVLKNLETGDTLRFDQTSIFSDTPGESKLLFNVPGTILAADYQATVHRGGMSITAPDRISVKYGKLELSDGPWGTRRDSSAELMVNGYNIYPENTYEVEISNGFFPVKKYRLDRKGYNSLSLKLPAEITPGNYNTKLFVNGKEYEPQNYPLDFLPELYVKRTANQPALVYVSQESEFKPLGDCYYFSPVATLSRKQNLIAYISADYQNHPNATIRMKLVNAQTRKEFILTTEKPRFTSMCYINQFFSFPIPAVVENGTYEAYAISGSEGFDLETSEKMGQLVRIE